MKTPICGVCLKSEILCNGCQRKVESGDVPEEAVEVFRTLHDLSDSIQSLKDVEIKRVVSTENVFILITEKGDAPKVVGRRGKIVKKIAEMVDKPVRILDDSQDLEEVVKNLISPVEIKAINTLYTPDGESKKVVVDEDDKNRVPISKSLFKELVEELAGEECFLSFE